MESFNTIFNKSLLKLKLSTALCFVLTLMCFSSCQQSGKSEENSFVETSTASNGTAEVTESTPAPTQQDYLFKQPEGVSTDDYEVQPKRDCSYAISDLEDALSYLRRASNSEDLDEAQNYARKAYNSFEDASSKASDCDCYNAESDISDASNYARRAKNADQLDELWDYVRKAKGYGDDGLMKLQNCN